MPKMWVRKASFFYLLMVGGMASAHASGTWQDARSVASSLADAKTAKSDQGLADLQQTNCPAGLERFVPGSYYYCVGVRDLARNEPENGAAMLKTAAGWGNKSAQYLLGVSYYRGAGLPMDRAQGLAWLELAAERKDPTYIAALQEAMREATPDEQAKASTLWQSMVSTYGDSHAARRAERRYRHERDVLMQNEVYGSKVCIAGITSVDVARADPRVPDYDSESQCRNAQPVALAAAKLDTFEDQLLEGWSGHVSVGQLQQVSSPRN